MVVNHNPKFFGHIFQKVKDIKKYLGNYCILIPHLLRFFGTRSYVIPHLLRSFGTSSYVTEGLEREKICLGEYPLKCAFWTQNHIISFWSLKPPNQLFLCKNTTFLFM